jgi:hypothetical protein
VAGVHSLVWDEAQKISGKDPDFNRRDLWESIEAGNFPEYELGVQLIAESDEFALDDIDLLDATKLVPEEVVPSSRSAGWCSTVTRRTSSPRPSRWPSASATSCPASTSPTTRCSRSASSPIWTLN